MNTTFHYPPELFKLLNDTIPKLCKSKKDLLIFLQGAGVSKATLHPFVQMLTKDKVSFNKYSVTQEVLKIINEGGDGTLAVRREIVKRVTEFQDFSVCWENDRAVARGLVAQIRDVVNVKDSFTRMTIEKDEERNKRIKEQEKSIKTRQEQTAKRQKVKDDLFALFGEADAHARGKMLERVLNELFSCYGILVREAFTVKGQCGEGIIEQIDGLIELEGHLYLVEMKWWNSPIGTAEIAQPLVRVFSRGGQVRGLFISYTDFTEPAIAQCRDAITQGKVVVLATLEEIVSLLGDGRDLKDWLKDKFNIALAEKRPYVKR